MPPGWNHSKLDLRNIDAIHRRCGDGRRLNSFPRMGLASYVYYRLVRGIRRIPLLDYVPYAVREAERILREAVGYRRYEKKHYESVFTRFYQGYILPRKFGVDKRRIHYSTLICSGQLSRDEAQRLMESGTYDTPALLEEDREYVLKKLGLSKEDLARYMDAPPIAHERYPSRARLLSGLRRWSSCVERMIGGRRG